MSSTERISCRKGLMLALVAVATLAAVPSACSSTKHPASTAAPSASPSEVAIASGTFSGRKTQVIDLGTHQVDSSVWVNRVLRGPYDARAIFSLRLRGADGGVDSTTVGPMSYGGVSSVTNDHAMSIEGVEPGTYRVTMVEIIRPQWEAGYAAKFKVLTSQAAQ